MALVPLLPGNLLQVPSAGTRQAIGCGPLVNVPGLGFFPKVGNLVRVGASDPLAGLDFFARWQTHVPGDNTPIGMFQDAALTIPATTEGATILGVNSVLSGSGAMTQTDAARKQTLHFDTSVPTISFAGTGAFDLPDMSALTEGELFVLFKPISTTSNDNFYLMGPGGGGVATYVPFTGDGNIYDSFGATARHNSITGTVPAGWVIYNASSQTGAWRNAINGTEIFSTATNVVAFPNAPMFGGADTNNWMSGGEVIALFLFSTVLTAPQRTLVNNYLASLIPPVITSFVATSDVAASASYTLPPIYDSVTFDLATDAGFNTIVQNFTVPFPVTSPNIFLFLTPNTQYWVRIKATIGGVDTAWSNTATVTTPPFPVQDIFFSQSGSGDNSGSDASNCNTLAWLNDSGNWGSADGKIRSNTTVHLVGTITSELQINGSGIAGFPITILFEAGAKLSQANGQLINLNSQQFITFDGGSNGIWENTDTGSGLGSQTIHRFIDATSSGNLIFKNLTIQNQYVHTDPTDHAPDIANAGAIYGGSMFGFNIFQGLTFSNCGWCIEVLSNSGSMEVTNCSFANYDHGVVPGGTDITITGCLFGSTANWDTDNNSYHHDGIHFYGGYTPASFVLSGNNFFGDWGNNNTAHIFLENAPTPPDNVEVYNNVHIQFAANYLSNGFMVCEGQGCKIYNNTYAGSGVALSAGIFVKGGTTRIFNNVFDGLNSFVVAEGTGPPVLDNNSYSNAVAGGNPHWSFTGSDSNTLADWQTASGQDAASVYNGTTVINSSGVPVSGSPTLGLGENFTSLFSVDYLGVSRPSMGAWTSGAFQNAASAPPIAFVQSKAGTNFFGASFTQATFDSPVTAGNLISVQVMWSGTAGVTLSTVTDTLGNTYTVVPGSAKLVTGVNYAQIAVQQAYCISGSSGVNVVTANFSANTDSVCICSIIESTPGTLDQTSVATGSSSTPSAGSVTTPSDGCLAIAVTFTDDSAGAGGGFIKGAGWTDLVQNSGGGSSDEASEYLTQTTAGSVTGDFTALHTGTWVASLMTFTP